MNFRLLQRNFSLKRLTSPLDYRRMAHMLTAWGVSKTLRITGAPVEFRFNPEPMIYLDGVLLAYEPGGAGGVLNMDADGPWEPEETRLLLESLKNGGVFYDIGANIGWHSINVALKTSATVVCFEPQPRRLRKNLALNNVTCTVVDAALGSRDGTAMMTSSYNAENFISEAGDLAVSLRRLDSLFSDQHLPPPTFIKLDVEGYEYEVLCGARDVLSKFRPDVLCEMSDLKERYGETNATNFLFELGYKISASFPLSHNRVGANCLFAG